jgi:hypothetical protein
LFDVATLFPYVQRSPTIRVGATDPRSAPDTMRSISPMPGLSRPDWTHMTSFSDLNLNPKVLKAVT